jgi:hypothetical protein
VAKRLDRWVAIATTVAIVLAVLAAIPEAIDTGRVYLFSREFLEDLPRRFSGPGRLRFILQPTVAILLGIRGGLVDARAGHPPYLFGLAFVGAHRRELLRTGFAAIRNLLAAGIVMDLGFQWVLYRSIHPGAALVVGPILICLPYATARALTTRVVSGSGRR